MNDKTKCINCNIEISLSNTRLNEDGYPICNSCNAKEHGMTEEELEKFYGVNTNIKIKTKEYYQIQFWSNYMTGEEFGWKPYWDYQNLKTEMECDMWLKKLRRGAIYQKLNSKYRAIKVIEHITIEEIILDK